MTIAVPQKNKNCLCKVLIYLFYFCVKFSFACERVFHVKGSVFSNMTDNIKNFDVLIGCF